MLKLLISEQNHENEIKLMFEQQAAKEKYLEKKKQEAERLRQQLDQMNDDKNYSQMEKLHKKSSKFLEFYLIFIKVNKSQENYYQFIEVKKSKLQKRSQDHFQTYSNYKTQSQIDLEAKISNYVSKLTIKQMEHESFNLI